MHMFWIYLILGFLIGLIFGFLLAFWLFAWFIHKENISIPKIPEMFKDKKVVFVEPKSFKEKFKEAENINDVLE